MSLQLLPIQTNIFLALHKESVLHILYDNNRDSLQLHSSPGAIRKALWAGKEISQTNCDPQPTI